MSVESEIDRLLALAAPLRCLPDDEPAKYPLATLVNEVNALRAVQAAPGYVPGGDEPAKRGRPSKAREEGADA